MKRLVLIGNGYDIAAGLDTKYEDFLVDYFKEMIKIAGKNLVKENRNALSVDDELIKVNAYYEQLNLDRLDTILEGISTIEGLFKHKMIRFDHLKTKEQWESENGVNTMGEADRFDITIHSNLLQQLFGDYNWRDIEGFYFERLIKEHQVIINFNKLIKTEEEKLEVQKAIKSNIEQLNIELEQLKAKLAEYLNKISSKLNYTNTGYPFSVINNINKEINGNLFKLFFNKGGVTKNTTSTIQNGLIVNFNYTSLLSEHLKWNTEERKNFDIINIHGSINKPSEIIFGYGDDTHPMYSELELFGEDEYLKHLKSFHYPLNYNYLQLIDFLEHDQFEVQILGHSLGLSDRVLLKSIFEHDNCKCIRLFHRGRKNEKGLMTRRYMALARHFDNKMIMRNKIVPFQMSDKLH